MSKNPALWLKILEDWFRLPERQELFAGLEMVSIEPTLFQQLLKGLLAQIFYNLNHYNVEGDHQLPQDFFWTVKKLVIFLFIGQYNFWSGHQGCEREIPQPKIILFDTFP